MFDMMYSEGMRYRVYFWSPLQFDSDYEEFKQSIDGLKQQLQMFVDSWFEKPLSVSAILPVYSIPYMSLFNHKPLKRELGNPEKKMLLTFSLARLFRYNENGHLVISTDVTPNKMAVWKKYGDTQLCRCVLEEISNLFNIYFFWAFGLEEVACETRSYLGGNH